MKKLKVAKAIIFTIIFLSLTAAGFVNQYRATRLNSIEIDVTSTATYIVDGDTFEISNGDRIRLADVDTPERGEWGSAEATNALSNMINNRKVYLDVDDVYWTDRYGRLVACVYVDYNSTHYLNVNKALLVLGYAEIWEFDNEFNPYLWTLFIPKIDSTSITRLLLISAGYGFVATVGIAYFTRKMWKWLSIRKPLK